MGIGLLNYMHASLRHNWAFKDLGKGHKRRSIRLRARRRCYARIYAWCAFSKYEATLLFDNKLGVYFLNLCQRLQQNIVNTPFALSISWSGANLFWSWLPRRLWRIPTQADNLINAFQNQLASRKSITYASPSTHPSDSTLWVTLANS